jgi:hypothetical protein
MRITRHDTSFSSPNRGEPKMLYHGIFAIVTEAEYQEIYRKWMRNEWIEFAICGFQFKGRRRHGWEDFELLDGNRVVGRTIRFSVAEPVKDK